MYRNLRGINNQRLLEETGLINKMREKGRNTIKNLKAGAYGVKDGFGFGNTALDAADFAQRTKNGEKIPKEEYNEKNQKAQNISDTMNLRRKNYSDNEKTSHSIGSNVGTGASILSRIPVAGIHGAKKLYDRYTK